MVLETSVTKGCLGLSRKVEISNCLLGGSWVVRSGAISRVSIPITHIRGLITPPILLFCCFRVFRASNM